MKSKLFFLIPLWAVAVAIGLHFVMVYKGQAGKSGDTPTSWPTNSVLALSWDRPTLVMFAHPKCPCTKASLGELESLIAQTSNRLVATVLFCEPGEPPNPRLLTSDWTNTTSINIAKAIPSVKVAYDLDGALAKEFGAETSGHVVLYNSDGHLLFSGGITGSRGHLGDNAGFETLVSLINSNTAPSKAISTPVFGCELFDQCTIQTATRN